MEGSETAQSIWRFSQAFLDRYAKGDRGADPILAATDKHIP